MRGLSWLGFQRNFPFFYLYFIRIFKLWNKKELKPPITKLIKFPISKIWQGHIELELELSSSGCQHINHLDFFVSLKFYSIRECRQQQQQNQDPIHLECRISTIFHPNFDQLHLVIGLISTDLRFQISRTAEYSNGSKAKSSADMLCYTFLLCIFLASGKKYLIETEAEDEAGIERVEMPDNSNPGDYSSSQKFCSIRLRCRVSKKRKDIINSGSCYFRYDKTN